MIPALNDLQEMFLSHWIVFVLGLLFLIVQLYACFRFLRTMRSWRVIVEKLQSSGHSGGQLSAYGVQFPWLGWINTHFPAGEDPRGNYSRDDVMKELDNRIAFNNQYILLQRLSVMAPLLGVLMTVGGAMLLNPTTDDLKRLDALYKQVIPVIAGVGIGALLAFVNQWLLHFCSRSADKLRLAARTWFDVGVWDALGNKTKSASERMMESLGVFAEIVQDSANDHQKSAKLMVEATKAIRHAAGKLQKSTGEFTVQIADLPPELKRLHEATDHAVTAIAKLVPTGQQVMGVLQESVSKFQHSVVEDFGEAARQHRLTMSHVGEATDVLRAATRVLFSECETLHASVKTQTDSLNLLNTSISTQVAPATQKFYDQVTQFNGASEELFDRLNALYLEVADGMERIGTLVPSAATAMESLSTSVGAFRQSVEGEFAPAAKGHRESLDQLSKSVHSISSGVEKLQQSSQLMADSAAAHSEVSASLKASVQEEMIPANAELRKVIAAFAPAADQLSSHVQSMGEAIMQARDELLSSAPSMREAFTGLQPAIDSFRNTVENELTEVAGKQKASVDRLIATADGLANSIEQLEQGGARWSDILQSQQESADKLQGSINDTVLPAHQAIGGAATEFSSALGGFREAFETAVANMSDFDPQVQKALGELTPSIAAFRSTIEGDLAGAAKDQQAMVKSLAQAVDRLNEAADTLRVGGESMNTLIAENAEIGRTAAPAYETLQQAVSRLTEAGEAMRSSFESDVSPAYRTMHEAAFSFNGSAEKLSEFIQLGVDPATNRLVKLDQSLAQVQLTADSLHNLAGASDQIVQLTQSLAQAANVAKAIEELPEKLHEALEKIANQHPNDRRGWLGMFGGSQK